MKNRIGFQNIKDLELINLRRKHYIIQHFEEAIANSYIKAYYQPVIRTINGQLCGLEALARWIDPELGFMSPAEFIPILEECHLITKLDLFILREVCREMKAAEKAGLTIIPVSINLSRIDFLDTDIFEDIERIILEYGIPRDMINIEITESMFMEDSEILKHAITSFRSGGYQVWMDDFGSGYSSLNVLKEYYFDKIKLDMAFLANFDDRSMKIIKTIVRMAKDIGIHTLAEGVETQEQFEFLREIGCETVQGYFFSKPLPIAEVLQVNERAKRPVEKRAWNSYYAKIGGVNFITDRTVGILEYDGENFKFLYVNKAYQEVWQNIGAGDMDSIHYNMNSDDSPLSHKFREFRKNIRYGDDWKTTYYEIRGHYVRIRCLCIAEQGEKSAYQVDITDFTIDERQKRSKMMSEVYRLLFVLYDSIYLMHLDTGDFDVILQSHVHEGKEIHDFFNARKTDARQAAQLFIHPEEVDEYVKYGEADTVLERLRAAKDHYLVKLFRTKSSTGGYVWKAHFAIEAEEPNHVIYAVRSLNIKDEKAKAASLLPPAFAWE